MNRKGFLKRIAGLLGLAVVAEKAVVSAEPWRDKMNRSFTLNSDGELTYVGEDPGKFVVEHEAKISNESNPAFGRVKAMSRAEYYETYPATEKMQIGDTFSVSSRPGKIFTVTEAR